MNLVGALTRRKSGTPYSGGYGGMAAPFVDAFNKNRAPSPNELIQENLGTAYACATLNADLVASTPLRLYIKTRKGQSKSRLSQRGDTKAVFHKTRERLSKIPALTKQVSDAAEIEEVTSHPVLDLLDRPNLLNEDGVGMSGFNLFNLTQLFQEIVGRCYWWVDKSGIGNTPSSIWILAAQRVIEIPAYGDNEKIIDYYQFSGGTTGKVRYEVDEVAPFRMPDLFNVYTGGVSPLRACFEQVKLSRKVDAQTNATLDNGGKPSAVWSPAANGEVGGILGRDEAARARKAFQQSLSQAGSGGILIQEHAGTLQMLNWPMKDIIDSSRMALTVDAICNAFSVPTTKLKRDHSNRASATTGDYAHAKDAGLPRLRRNEAALNHFLLPMYGQEAGDRLFFAYDDPPGMNDDESERTEYNNAANRGSVTRNQDRQRLGMPDEPWGDQPLAPNTMVAVDKVTGIPEKAPPPSINFGNQPDGNKKNVGDGETIGLLKSINSYLTELQHSAGHQGNGHSVSRRQHRGDESGTTGGLRHPDRENGEGILAVRSVGLKETPVRTFPSGAGIKAACVKAFTEQRHAILGQVNDHQHVRSVKAEDKAPELPKAFIPLDKWTDQIARESMPTIEVIMGQEGRKLLTRVGASPDAFSVFEKNIPQTAEKLALKFSESTNATTTQKLDEAISNLRQEISDGLVQGDTRQELTNRVQEIFDEADTSRAETIAQTESSRAVHQGELKGAKDSGVVSGKYWIASSDACDICSEFSDQGTIPLDQDFGADDYGPISSAPGHPRCQCSVGYSIKDDQT